MELYIVRHAIAVNRNDPQVSSDADRWLTKEGIEKMELTAEGLKKIVPTLDEIFSSPFLRAQQTAEIIQHVYKQANLVKITSDLAPGVDPDVLQDLTKGHSPNARIALVGHEPDLSELISMTVTGSTDSDIKMKKGAVCRVDIEGKPKAGTGILMWLLHSKHLRMIAKSK